MNVWNNWDDVKAKAKAAAEDRMQALFGKSWEQHQMKGSITGITDNVIEVIFKLVIGFFLIFFLGGALLGGLTVGTTAYTAVNNIINNVNTAVTNNLPSVLLILVAAIGIVVVLYIYHLFSKGGKNKRGM